MANIEGGRDSERCRGFGVGIRTKKRGNLIMQLFKSLDLNTDLLGMRDISDASNRKTLKASGLRVSSLGSERANQGKSGYGLFIRIHALNGPLTVEGFVRSIQRALPYSGAHLTVARLKLAKVGNAYLAQVNARKQATGQGDKEATPLAGNGARAQGEWKTKQRWGGNIMR